MRKDVDDKRGVYYRQRWKMNGLDEGYRSKFKSKLRSKSEKNGFEHIDFF